PFDAEGPEPVGSISPECRDLGWKWVQKMTTQVIPDNWDHISKTWGSGFLVTRFISFIVSQFSSNEKADEVEEFFSTRSKPSVARTLKQSMERVRINLNWVRNVKQDDSLAAVVKELANRKI
ncbi:hypothetical protein Taro_003915, partial [Colocasia esculenta]|nr:hypothetical protein [Colocasia esculenta]